MSQDSLNETSREEPNNEPPVDLALGAEEEIRVGRRLVVAAFFMMLIITIVEISVKITIPSPIINPQVLNIVLWVAAFLAFFAGLFGINKIGIGAGMPVGRRVLKMLLLVLPYVNLLTLIYVYYRARQYLKQVALHSPVLRERP